MAITYSANYLAELAKGLNKPDTIVEIELDGGTQKFGLAAGNSFTDVLACLKSVSSNENVLDTEKGWATLGTRKFVLEGRDNFKTMIQDERLKNRRVNIMEGFRTDTFTYSDYAPVFTGKILNWTRNGDEISITVADDMRDGTIKIPVENSTGTQSFEFPNRNPVDCMLDIIRDESTFMAVASGLVDGTQFTTERDIWLLGWAFHRVITEPTSAKDLLKELQEQSNSFIVHDGEKISYKVFAPLLPGQTVKEYNDTHHLSKISMESGSKGLINRVVVAFDWNEDGDDLSDYDSVEIAEDATSQSQHLQINTRTIKSKWIRSLRWTRETDVTGVVIYHASRVNGAGTGLLDYNQINQTLRWQAPSGTYGDTVTLDKDGKYDLFDANKNKFIRVVVTLADLDGSDQSDIITLITMAGSTYAASLAKKILNRFRDPVATIKATIDMNHAVDNSQPIFPTRVFTITTDEAGVFGKDTLVSEQVMATKVKPSGFKVDLTFFQTKLFKRYGFIGSGTVDYDNGSADHDYAFIADSSDQLGAANDGPYLTI